jgi:hypothetical protein
MRPGCISPPCACVFHTTPAPQQPRNGDGEGEIVTKEEQKSERQRSALTVKKMRRATESWEQERQVVGKRLRVRARRREQVRGGREKARRDPETTMDRILHKGECHVPLVAARPASSPRFHPACGRVLLPVAGLLRRAVWVKWSGRSECSLIAPRSSLIARSLAAPKATVRVAAENAFFHPRLA